MLSLELCVSGFAVPPHCSDYLAANEFFNIYTLTTSIVASSRPTCLVLPPSADFDPFPLRLTIQAIVIDLDNCRLLRYLRERKRLAPNIAYIDFPGLTPFHPDSWPYTSFH